jgi:hypothetical protein
MVLYGFSPKEKQTFCWVLKAIEILLMLKSFVVAVRVSAVGYLNFVLLPLLARSKFIILSLRDIRDAGLDALI